LHYPTRPTPSPRLTPLPQWVMERTYHAVDSEEHALNEPLIDLRGSHEDEEFTRAAGIHLASIAEKKRLWLKNAVLNALFITIWSVDSLQ
jgi:solute carrier family 35, member C2